LPSWLPPKFELSALYALLGVLRKIRDILCTFQGEPDDKLLLRTNDNIRISGKFRDRYLFTASTEEPNIRLKGIV
jgi:hypothetical protein